LKYFLIPFIALGIGLSLILGTEYTCSGADEMLPNYYGHPFIFKHNSSATSLEYQFSLVGIILNTAFWSILIMILRLLVLRLIKLSNHNKILLNIYKVSKGLVSLFTIFILFSTILIEMDSDINNIDFYWSIDKEALEWGCAYQAKLMIFK